jgi:hypothetical protein
MSAPDDSLCGRPTKKGSVCRARLHYVRAGDAFQAADGCWTHMDPGYRQLAEQREREKKAAWQAWLTGIPACWSWPVPPDLDTWSPPQGEDINDRLSDKTMARIMGDPEIRAGALLSYWQAGRCAICGSRPAPVEDHDHRTALTRGYLCRSCNTREGIYRGGDNVFTRYRECHPTKLLGLTIRYVDPYTGEEAQPIAPYTRDAAHDPFAKVRLKK